jgi:hypothetical protein
MAKSQNNSGCCIKGDGSYICIKHEDIKPVYTEEHDDTPGMYPVKLDPQTGAELSHYPEAIWGTSECKPDVIKALQYGHDMVQSAAYLGDTKACINTESLSCIKHDNVSQTGCEVDKTESPHIASDSKELHRSSYYLACCMAKNNIAK